MGLLDKKTKINFFEFSVAVVAGTLATYSLPSGAVREFAIDQDGNGGKAVHSVLVS